MPSDLGRIRYDLVALLALLASIACGIVKPADAFRGFSDDIESRDRHLTLIARPHIEHRNGCRFHLVVEI